MSMNKKAFSFIEVFISLIVLSLILSALATVNQSYQGLINRVNYSKTAEFQHFLVLLDKEINKYFVKAVSNNRIVLRDFIKDNDQYLIAHNNKIYLTPGHQPLLYGVKDWSVTLVNQRLFIIVEFVNGESEQGSVEISLYKDTLYGR